MLTVAAFLLMTVSAMHSLLGGINLINPICSLPDLPIILGSRRITIMTLQCGWHFLSLLWVALALLLVGYPSAPTDFSRKLLYGGAVLFAVYGLTALVASRGRHLSWVFFFPIGGLFCAVAQGMG